MQIVQFVTLYNTLVISLFGNVLAIGLSLGNLGWSDPEPLAACAMLSGRLTSLIAPGAPAPLPPGFPPSPPPPAAAFTPGPCQGGGVSRGSGPRTRSPGAPLVLCPSLREVTTNQAPILGTPVTETRALVRDNQILLAPSEITPHTKWPDQDTQHIQTFYPFTAGCKVFLTKVTKLSPGGGEFLRVLVRPKLDTEL